MGLVIPISIIWKLQNGLSVPEAIFTESIILFATAIADLPAGLIANHLNNKKSLVIGGLLHLIGMVLLFVGGSFTVFAIAGLFTGIAWAFISGADEAYIHDDFIEEKSSYKKVFSTSNIVDESFTIIGMLSSSALVFLQVPLRHLFFTAAIILMAHLIYTITALPSSQNFAKLHPLNTSKIFSKDIFKNREILIVIAPMIAFAVIYEAGRPLWQPHMQNIGLNIETFGIIFALLKLASIAGSFMARAKDFSYKLLSIIFSIMLTSLLLFGTNVVVISLGALAVFLFTENYFRVYMSIELNKLIKSNRVAMLSFGSVVRNSVGALLVMGAAALSSKTIVLAIIGLVIIKIPAIFYILKTSKSITKYKI